MPLGPIDSCQVRQTLTVALLSGCSLCCEERGAGQGGGGGRRGSSALAGKEAELGRRGQGGRRQGCLSWEEAEGQRQAEAGSAGRNVLEPQAAAAGVVRARVRVLGPDGQTSSEGQHGLPERRGQGTAPGVSTGGPVPLTLFLTVSGEQAARGAASSS